MLRGVDFAVDVEDLLSARDMNVVDRLKTKMIEAGAHRRTRCNGQPDAGSPSVKIKSEVRAPVGYVGYVGAKSTLDIGIIGKDRSESVLDNYADAQIGTSLLQQ